MQWELRGGSFELYGKTLGLVGLGRIGREVAARAVPFGARVVYFDPEVAPPSDLPVTRVEVLDELLAQSDVVSLHAPLARRNCRLINREALRRMKPTAVLVNTSRGPVVDEAALAWALKNRMISGAALDVYEEEPKVHPDLLTLENVVLAPHLGSATTETRTAMADLAVRNAIARASDTLRHLDWFEVTQVRGQIKDGQVEHFQVGMKVGFRLEDEG